jgi:hypothetical protein
MSKGQFKKKKSILPRKPILPPAKERDRLAWALQRGWLKPAQSRKLTVFVIETRKGLPLSIRIRDWVLMSFAWGFWTLLLFDAAKNDPTESGQLVGPGYWPFSMYQELLFGLIVSASLVLVLMLFGTFTLYRFRNPIKKIHEPEPLKAEEQASSIGLNVKALKEWRMAKSLHVEISDEGNLDHYEIFPKEVPDSFIL